jgi:hypothetical protein
MQQDDYIPHLGESIKKLKPLTERFARFPHLTWHLSAERREQLKAVLKRNPTVSLNREHPRLVRGQFTNRDGLEYMKRLVSRADERIVRMQKEEEVYLQELEDLSSTKTRANFIYLPQRKRRIEHEIATLSVKMACEFRLIMSLISVVEEEESEEVEEIEEAKEEEENVKEPFKSEVEEDNGDHNETPMKINLEKWNLSHVLSLSHRGCLPAVLLCMDPGNKI